MHVRLSGGGVVPQGAGVVNLHLSYIVNTPNPLLVAEAHYQALCGLLAKLFEHFGIRTNTQTVQGSFCDGRYNLAAAGHKIAGTAQHWQRDQSAANRYRVLSHAVILAADPAMLTERANRFEQALGMVRRGGTISLNGLPPGDFPLPIFSMVLKGITVRGSIVGTRLDLQESLDFAAQGKVKATVSTDKLENINDIFARMHEGKIEGRVVLDIAA